MVIKDNAIQYINSYGGKPQVLLNRGPHSKINPIITPNMENTSKTTTIDPDSYHTPCRTLQTPSHQNLFGHTRMFISHKKKHKRSILPPQHSSDQDKLPHSQKAGLMRLAEWLRWSAVSLGVGKHVFDNALAVLTESSHKMESTYALAAASLLIATKLEHGTFISKYRHLPAKPANRVPRVHLSDASKVEGLLLNTLDFSLPVASPKIQLLLSLTESWNIYLARNSRKIKLPLHLLQAGLAGKWQKRNLSCASYLLDLLSMGASGHFSTEQIYLTASLIVVGAVNSCQIQMITSPNFILVKFAKMFLSRYYKSSEEELQDLMRLLQGIVQHRLWQKLSLVPSQKQEPSPVTLQTQQQKLQWLNQLTFIPFSADTPYQK